MPVLGVCRLASRKLWTTFELYPVSEGYPQVLWTKVGEGGNSTTASPSVSPRSVGGLPDARERSRTRVCPDSVPAGSPLDLASAGHSAAASAGSLSVACRTYLTLVEHCLLLDLVLDCPVERCASSEPRRCKGARPWPDVVPPRCVGLLGVGFAPAQPASPGLRFSTVGGGGVPIGLGVGETGGVPWAMVC